MPKEWTVLHQGAAGTEGAPGYYVSSRKVGIFGSGKPADAGRFDTKEEADAFVATHKGIDDSMTHIERPAVDAR